MYAFAQWPNDQRKARRTSSKASGPRHGQRFARPAATPVQQTGDVTQVRPASRQSPRIESLGAPGRVQETAARGLAGSSTSLPHGATIQRAFGRHSIAGVNAHIGGPARAATSELLASAYSTGNRIAFRDAPDLRTVAHEAAHIVQQRTSLHLPGGVGQTGDRHERHANAVADAVVRGASAEPLLDQYVVPPSVRALRPVTTAPARAPSPWLSRMVQQQSIPDARDLARRGADLLRRGWGWGERRLEEVEEYGERAYERGREAAEGVGEELERWRTSGTGNVTKIEFDGSQAKLRGTTPLMARAVSGLMPGHPDIAAAGLPPGTDCTQPAYQHLANIGPIPEGKYYIDPSDVQDYPRFRFNTGAWGRYRTRLHESSVTSFRRRLTTDRSGGFYLHQDANHNGTAGCIGIWTHADNKAFHLRIQANSARIPVEVKYPAPPPSGGTGGGSSGTVQQSPQTASQQLASVGFIRGAVIQRQEEGSSPEPETHPLVAAGVERLRQDAARYGERSFPADYYDTLARHLFAQALRSSGNYSQAFGALNDLQWGRLGAGVRLEYERVVGTDSTNGYDKFRHFVYTAYLQYRSGGFLAPEVFTYGKELFDEVEGWFGADPEGYSVEDVRADNRGEAFAEEMRAREIAENRARLRAEWEATKRAFGNDPAAARWFLRRLSGH